MSKKVFLGVGHGGSDSGVVSNGLKEKDINLNIALECCNELERHGVIVQMSRYKDENDPINEEVKKCNIFKPDLAIDIHTNADGGKGFEVYYYSGGGISKDLAKNIEKEVICIGQNSRGIKTRVNNGVDYYAFIRDTAAPAIICECAFIDNKEDVKMIDTIQKQQSFGVVYAKGILKTLGISYIPEDNTNTNFTREQFIDKIKNIAIEESKRVEILPSITIAQAILESNNGNSELAKNANALFGIKANNWSGKTYNKLTHEYVNGVKVQVSANFRAYNTWEESIKDHSNFLLKDRYKALIGEIDYKKACQALYNAGYATDPEYPSKLINLIEKHKLHKFDKGADNMNSEIKELPEYKVRGEKYLRDMLYTSSEHDPLEVIDFGTLGIILMNYNKDINKSVATINNIDI